MAAQEDYGPAAVARDNSGAVIPHVDRRMADLQYRTHIFTGGGTLSFLRNTQAEYLVVGGGGGGGSWYAGGGGGGGLLNATTTFARGDYSVSVGAGGLGRGPQADGDNGGNSSLGRLVAIGGGGGAGWFKAGKGGGSGGGGTNGTPGLGTAGQGNNGGGQGGGGGGGAGGAGTTAGDATSANVAGGAGLRSAITGSLVTYSAGGIGSNNNASPQAASLGSGGHGQQSNNAGSVGTNGGSGIVVVRYRITQEALHPEAERWLSDVYGNGGACGRETMRAVSRFCADIDAAGIRDRFYRLNLFCGTGLSAALVPLYRGQSLGGTQFGGATDTNSNFVSGDYVETGSTGGLLGNGSSKYLNTGLNANVMPDLAQSGHLSVYAAGTFSGQIALGVYAFTNPPFVVTHESELQLGATQANTHVNLNASGQTPSYTSPAFIVGSRTSTTNHIGYANGVAGTAVTATANFANPAQPFFVFARNLGGGPAVHFGQRLRSYSIGLGMTGSQVTAFNNATQALQAALGRNV